LVILVSLTHTYCVVMTPNLSILRNSTHSKTHISGMCQLAGHSSKILRACLVGVYAVTLDPLFSLYGIIYVTWYTRHLPKPTGVRFRYLSVYQVT